MRHTFPLSKTSRFICAAIACAAVNFGAAPSLRALMTDLGDEGNAAVADTFTSYKSANPSGACKAAGGGKHVIVTGYGLFAGRNYNISGEVVRAMADASFWPGKMFLSGKYKFPHNYNYTPRMSPQDFSNGAIVSNRSLYINNEEYEVCFMALDVIWDQAGAILIYESGRFKPEMIMMTGGGAPEARFEGAAVNSADKLPGYNSHGTVSGQNAPVSSWLLEDYPAGHVEKTTWDGSLLAYVTRNEITKLGYTVSGPAGQSPGNDYLCNNITYLALHATQHELPTNLAGNRTDGYKISLPAPGLPQKPVVGFFHFPDVPMDHPDLSRYGDGVFGWAKVIAAAIQSSLGSSAAAAPQEVAVPVSAAAPQPVQEDSPAMESLRGASFQ